MKKIVMLLMVMAGFIGSLSAKTPYRTERGKDAPVVYRDRGHDGYRDHDRERDRGHDRDRDRDRGRDHYRHHHHRRCEHRPDGARR